MPFALAQAAVMGLLAGGEPGHAILTELGDARPVLVDGAKSLRVEAGEPGWTLAGEVSHTYGARWAALAVVVAADRDGELALHGVWLDDARVAVEPAEQRTGLRGSGAARLRFDDAPAVRSIVDPEAAMRASRYLELACAAIALGTAAGALDAAIAYMRERRQFGQALTDFPALRAMVGSRALELEAGGLHILEAALREDALGEAGDPHVAAATESAMRAAWAAVDDAVQLHGGYGYVREYGVERRMRDVTSLRARAGAAHRRHARVAEPPMLPARS
jgi:alkylation response protein AidB-like acyl-CoA dehydrogenase